MPVSDLSKLVELHEAPLVDAIFADPVLARGIGIPPQLDDPILFRLRVRPEALRLSTTAFGDVDALLIKV